MNTSFDLKTIDFLGRQCTILCQNENGPCPLLAIANVLILQNKIHFHPERCRVMLDELVEVVANSIIEKGLSIGHDSEEKKGSEQQQLDSALNVIPNMARGLDLNIFFSDVASFEFTEEISVFDALDIPLLHGWVLDPQDDTSFSVINSNCSYNHLMYKLVEYRSVQERISCSPASPQPEPKSFDKCSTGPPKENQVEEFTRSNRCHTQTLGTAKIANVVGDDITTTGRKGQF